MHQHCKRALVMGASTVLLAGVTAAPAIAGPGDRGRSGDRPAAADQRGASDSKDHRKAGKGHRNGQPKGSSKSTSRSHAGGDAKDRGTGRPGTEAQPEAPRSGPERPGRPGGSGSPPGNNGSVKIIGAGDIDGVPENNPHVGCDLGVEWYGFDEGADVVSTVSFAMHAPTADVGLAVTGPGQVFVGRDPAGGGTDLDGREFYTLDFTGAPHPTQGYHVKLTVSTPRSRGNDTKTKVFWVEDCAEPGTPDTPGGPETPGTPDGPETPGTPDGPETPGTPDGPETPGGPVITEEPVLPATPGGPGEPGEMIPPAGGLTPQSPFSPATAPGAPTASLPTRIDAGLVSAGDVRREGDLLAPALLGFGGVLAFAGLALRRRSPVRARR